MLNNKYPIEFALNCLKGKWKCLLLYCLFEKPRRFSEFQKQFPNVSNKVLIQQLNELISDKLVYKIIYPESPPRVEYFLSENGKNLIPILEKLGNWAKKIFIFSIFFLSKIYDLFVTNHM